jgi:hypothetical protein
VLVQRENIMTKRFITLRLHLTQALVRRSDAGQGTLEYVGMIIVAAVIAVAVMGALKGVDLGNAVTTAVNSVLGK